MQVSIGGLFAAGIVPGLLLGLALVIANSIFAHRQNHPGGRRLCGLRRLAWNNGPNKSPGWQPNPA
jgi:TRAP-type C4-dicarboxylate transport system permease large subunit